MQRQTFLLTVDLPSDGYLSPEGVMRAIERIVPEGTPVKADLQSSVPHEG